MAHIVYKHGMPKLDSLHFDTNKFIEFSSKVMDDAIVDANQFVDWEKIFSNLPWNAYHHLRIEMSALGMWFDHIPKHIIADSKLIKLFGDPIERSHRIKDRNITEELRYKFDKFYSDPPFFDESIKI